MNLRIMIQCAALCCCIAAVSGCGYNPHSEAGQVIIGEETKTEGKILTFYAPMDTKSGDATYYRDLINQYNAEQEEIQVVFEGTATADGFNEFLEQRLDAGEGDDLFIVNADMVKPLYRKGYFYDMSSIPAFQTLNDSVREQAVIGDITYCIPVSMTSYGLFVNLDIMDRYGLVPPKDLEELLNCCRTVKEHGITPFSLNRWYAMTVPVMANGLYPIYGSDHTGEIRDGLNRGEVLIGDSMLEGFQLLEEFIKNDWYGENLNSETVDSIKAGTQDISDFAAGRTAFCFSHLNALNMIEELNSNLNYQVQGIPVPNGTVAMPSVMTRLCINNNSENLEEAVAFAEYLTDKMSSQRSSGGSEFLPSFRNADFELLSEKMRPLYEIFLTGEQIPIEDMQIKFTYWDTTRELCISMFDGTTAEEAAASFNQIQAESIAKYSD